MKIALVLLTFVLGTFLSAQSNPTLNDIWIPTRDGDSLQADVYIPVGIDSAQVILIQTPYNKNTFEGWLPLLVGANLNSNPYIWVIVDWRGFYGSNGADVSNFKRSEDGYDICQWISQQTWHKSRIGTWGPSALGGVQYETARENHPNHTCAVPMVAHGQQSYDAYFTGGVLEKARLYQLDALGYGLSPVVLANPYNSNVWTFSANNTNFPPLLKIPTLQIGGWYDHNIDKMMTFYKNSRNQADVSVRNKQWLLVGPWVHGGSGAAYVGSANQGELSYPNAAKRSDTLARQFLDFFLLDLPNGWSSMPKINYYEMGTNVWRTSEADDIEITNENSLYLNGFKTLTSTTGTGMSSITVDPRNPSPTIGGATLSTSLDQGPYNQISLDNRADIATFSSEVLSTAVSMTGRASVKLFVSSNQPDGDISIRLVDHYPDGRSMLITDGMKRLRFRNGNYFQSDEQFMSPGQVYEVEVMLPFTHYTWLPGHQIKLYVGGNNAIRYDVNLQNGGTMYVAGDTNTAQVQIHHTAQFPSRLILPGNNPTLGLEAINSIQFNVSPNPTNKQLKINYNGEIEAYEILDLSGRIVKTGTSKVVDVQQLDNSMYYIRVYASGLSSTLLFMKN